ncbi:MAG: hypothetical protein RCO49_01090 [Rickettsia endosymbiont of Argas persicus]
MSEYKLSEEETSLKSKNSRKELKAILITFIIILTIFLTLCYFFFSNVKEKEAECTLQEEAEFENIDETEL